MVRLSVFALCAALLVSAPEPSFAEAAPALNPHLPRQTMKPRFAHNNPKHIKRREFTNVTTSASPSPPKVTSVEVTTQAPASQQDESTTDGILGINVSPAGGVTVTAGGAVPISIGSPLGGDSSSSAPVSSNPQTSIFQTTQARSASAEPVAQVSSLLSGLGSSLGLEPESSSSNSENPASSKSQSARPSTEAAATASSPGTQSAAKASPSSASNPADPLSGLGGILTTAEAGPSSAVAPVVSVASSAIAPVVSAASSAIEPVVSAASTAVAPVVSDASTAVAPVVSDASTAVAPVVSDASTAVAPVVSDASTAVAPVVSAASTAVAPVVSDASTAVAPVVSDASTAVAPVVSDASTAVAPVVSDASTAVAPVVSDASTAVAPIVSDASTAVQQFTSDLGSQLSTAVAPITSLVPTDSPSNPATLLSPTNTGTPLISIPTFTSSSPATETNSNPATTNTASQSQPTGPITQTVVPIPATSSHTDTQAQSSAPQSASAQSASALSQSTSALSQSASASPETQTAPASSAASSPSAITQPQTQSASAQPASTEQPTPTITSAPTAPASTAPTATSIAATGSDTQTQIYVPTSLVIDTATQTPYNPPASTAAYSSNGIPSTMPHIIPPPGSGLIPTQPDGTTLIQIGFQYQLNYPFVLSHSSAIYQIFEILPWGLAYGLDINHSNITMQSLQPYDTSRTEGYITTVALAYIPSSSVNNLTIGVPNPGSMLYKNPNATRAALMSVIDPNFPVLAGSGLNQGDGTGSSNPASTSVIADSNPLDVNNQGATGVNGTAVGIGVGVCAGAAVYGAAMFFIAKRYKQRKASRHSRSSSMIDTASMANSTHEQQTGAGTALMSNGPDGSYGTRGGSRNSGGSGGSSRGRGEISAPVMAENSLGWN